MTESTIEFDLLVAFETHDVAKIREILDAGLDPRSMIKGRSLVNNLTIMYSRSDAFPECLRLLLERGALLDDPALAPVLLDDGDALREALRRNPALIGHRTSMESSFTPLVGASLLHVASEFGNANAARVLLEAGADVDARAATDEHGLNGHTPIFHTVNSAWNRSAPIMHMLLDAGASADVRVNGITWGKGMEWETLCFDVTPISYAQMGLLPQCQRQERDIYANIARLLAAAGRSVPTFDNVPNKYLNS
jgi:ankyrin repeat protein